MLREAIQARHLHQEANPRRSVLLNLLEQQRKEVQEDYQADHHSAEGAEAQALEQTNSSKSIITELLIGGQLPAL